MSEPIIRITQVANLETRLTTAGSSANDAYAQANAAYARANTANGQANNAYTQANSAYLQANNAYEQANAAYSAANNAQVTVYANNASNVTTQNINFVNTSTVSVNVFSSGSNANVEFSFNPAGGITGPTGPAGINGPTGPAGPQGPIAPVETSMSSLFTANGSANTFTLNSNVGSANNLIVSIDGVVTTPNVDYTVSNNNLTILYTPPNNSIIEARTISGSGGGGSLSVVVDQFTADGSNNSFTLSTTPTNKDYCIIHVDRVIQRNNEYNVTGTTLSFTSMPDANSIIDVLILGY